MPLTLKAPDSPPLIPFSWDSLPSPSPPPEPASLPNTSTSWLSTRDMKMFGAQPIHSDVGLVRCKDCDKPILRSFMVEHAANCLSVRSGGAKKGIKGKSTETEASKKRKASPSPDDSLGPQKKKAKPATKVTKGRFKGPVDFDKQCGVINDKGLPCSRSLTCKSHSMGAKRSVEGRSRKYDDLLLDWQREHNPNWVEPVKRETKAEKKEKREKEKNEKKRLAEEAAAAAGIDLSVPPPKKTTAAPTAKKMGSKKAAAAAAAASKRAEEMGEDGLENMDDLDSEAEVDALVKAVHSAREKGVIATPLAIPCDAGSLFVQRRERARCCRDLLMRALGTGNPPIAAAMNGNFSRAASVVGGS